MIEKYFGDVDKNNIEFFKTNTPQGNIIEGYICKARNRYLGSMLITKIYFKQRDETVETEQFIQSMPKMYYHSEKHSMYSGESEGVVYPVYEKLDGTCLILYGLYYKNELVEIVPKTRGMPVADNKIIEMYNELDHCKIFSFFKQTMHLNPTIMFELYGTLNQHLIVYPDIRISMKLLGATLEGDFCNYFEVAYLASEYDFVLPDTLFTLYSEENKWTILIKNGVLHYYLYDKYEFPIKDLTQEECVNLLSEIMTTANEHYKEVNGYELLEGGVINCYNNSGEDFKYLKVKPEGITFQAKRAGTQVPKGAIKKEINKYFDEYGSNAKQLYIEDKTHYYNYVRDGLLEEFSEEMVDNKKTKNKIRLVFEDKLQKYSGGGKLRKVCETIFEENPNLEVSDYMRIFSEYYPERKSRSAKAFNIFSELLDS